MSHQKLFYVGIGAILFWGGVLVYFYATGLIDRNDATHDPYLAKQFPECALAGGLGLCVLGLFNLLMSRARAGCGHDHGDGGHDHESFGMTPV